MRKRWYKGVKDKFKKLSLRMVGALYQVVGNNEDTFLDMTGGLVGVLSKWDAVTAKIPTLWTKIVESYIIWAVPAPVIPSCVGTM